MKKLPRDSARRKPVVYIVDPDETVRENMRSLLKTLDCEVMDFGTAKAFLDSFDSLDSHCLVMEMHLPNMTGLDLLERLRERDVPIPVIILAKHSDVPMAVEAMRGGAIDFIEKPFVDRVLFQRIHSALDRSKATVE